MEKKHDSIHINILEALEMQPGRVQNQKIKKAGPTELKLDEEEMSPPTSRKIL